MHKTITEDLTYLLSLILIKRGRPVIDQLVTDRLRELHAAEDELLALKESTALPEKKAYPHNPAGVSDWGQAEGYRLLDNSEILSHQPALDFLEVYVASNKTWLKGHPGGSRYFTYRTKLSMTVLAQMRKKNR